MDGILNIYKPSGITSFDVVKKVMKLCNTKKVGHTGTLDPLASGVLPICVGKGTKIVEYVMSEKKVYKAQLMLGIITDTYDREGTILSFNKDFIEEDKIVAAINSFVGDIEQEPPMYSALKVNGKRLYELARKGIVIEREKRPVSIYKIDILDIEFPVVTFAVTCSKGTYIRSLCKDIGDKLGVGGIMNDLERMETGSFTKSDSVKLELLNSENIRNYIIPIDAALEQYETLNFNSNHERLLINGVKINNPYILQNIESDKLYRVYIDKIKFIGLGIRDEIGFKIVKLLI